MCKKILDQNFWNDRYINNTTGWDLGATSPPLLHYLDTIQIPKKTSILIPGAGNAHEARLLHQRGYTNVHVVDIAHQPLENIKNTIPNFPTTRLHHQDFFKHAGAYDLIIEQTFFCAIDPLLRKQYRNKMHELLNPNGKLIGLFFKDVTTKQGPPFPGNRAEYVTLFSSHFNIDLLEDCYNSHNTRASRELFFVFTKK